jgi:hypothetical protein
VAKWFSQTSEMEERNKNYVRIRKAEIKCGGKSRKDQEEAE